MGKAAVIGGMAIGIAILGARAGAEAQPDRSAVPLAGSIANAIANMVPMHGLWRGNAMVIARGKATELIHTERVGPSLGGAIEVIEGRSYNKDGSEAGFNALAVVSCPGAEAEGCEMRSYAQGRAATFPFTIRADGFDWSQPAGPDATIAYHAVIADDNWHEEGWFEKGGKRLGKVYEANLKRIGTTDWPAAGAVAAQ